MGVDTLVTGMHRGAALPAQGMYHRQNEQRCGMVDFHRALSHKLMDPSHTVLWHQFSNACEFSFVPGVHVQPHMHPDSRNVSLSSSLLVVVTPRIGPIAFLAIARDELDHMGGVGPG